MKPYEKMRGKNGLENALFPLEELYCTRGSHHGDDYNYDFLGYVNNQRVYKCPLYASFSGKVVYVGSLASNTPTVVWESLNRVNFVDGSVDYMCISISHDDNFASYNIGDIKNQGEIFAHTGTTGEGTGDHTHLICGKGKFTGFYTTPKGGYTLKNQYDLPLCLGINDTTILQGLGFNWQIFKDDYDNKDFIVLSLVNALKWSI